MESEVQSQSLLTKARQSGHTNVAAKQSLSKVLSRDSGALRVPLMPFGEQSGTMVSLFDQWFGVSDKREPYRTSAADKFFSRDC